MKIVVVEYDDAVLDVVSIILKQTGCIPVPCTDSRKLLKTVLETKPRLVLLDVMTGGEDQMELCKEIKATKEIAHIPVIVFSTVSKFKDNFKEYMCDDFLEKPFDINELIKKVKNFTGSQVKIS